MRLGRVVLVCYQGKYLDRVRVTEVHTNPPRLEGKSLERAPGRKDAFEFAAGGWKRIFSNPSVKAPSVLEIFETSHT